MSRSTSRRLTLEAISLLVGIIGTLVALTTPIGTYVWSYFSSQSASLSGAVVYADGDGVQFSLTNDGNQTASIVQAAVTGKFPDDRCRPNLEIESWLDPETFASVIEPAKTQSYRAKFPAHPDLYVTSFASDVLVDPKMTSTLATYRNCTLKVHYVDHHKSLRQVSFPFACIAQVSC
ncbi:MULTISPECIES: hypothetical protein [unclassified Sinorhizobium]|uniref:hypothetical protein n=1 Tax=unclassified Sinorhizobium TaxID=2613772 RepID=UPI0024C340F7|nr:MULTISPECIES: hypothetical protein [unclassified Sinorhizobium]MDK1378118.1 hypothetical protein [Sinorhizobium sp. 6-70]MDK1483042.1 hypothetical protein [Sinorhizobium sp. 6-117]